MGVTRGPAGSGGAPGLGIIYEDGTLGGGHPRVAVCGGGGHHVLAAPPNT